MKIWRALAFLLLLASDAFAKARPYEPFDYDHSWRFFTRLYRLDELPDGNRQTSIEWTNWRHNSWRIEASEQSLKYPMTYLFDGSARTAWVASSRPCGLSVVALRPVMMDSIRIMNGYNRTSALFRRNNRVVKMDVWLNGRKLKTVRLSDKMGWHRIHLPRRKVGQIGFDFQEVVRGRDNDVCISEVEFYNGRRKINLSLPPVVLFDPGNPSEDPPRVLKFITQKGAPITGITETVYGLGATPLASWSPNNRYACDIRLSKSAKRVSETDEHELFVVDGLTRRIIWRRKLPPSIRGKYDDRFFARLDWIDNRVVELTTAEEYDEKGYVGAETFRFCVR